MRARVIRGAPCREVQALKLTFPQDHRSCFVPGTACQDKMQVPAERLRESAGTALLWQLLGVVFAQVFLPCWEEAVKQHQGTVAHRCSLAGTRQGEGEALGSPGWAAHAGKCPAGPGSQVPACCWSSPVPRGSRELLGRRRCCSLCRCFRDASCTCWISHINKTYIYSVLPGCVPFLSASTAHV